MKERKFLSLFRKYLVHILLLIGLNTPVVGVCSDREVHSLKLELRSLGDSRVELKIINNGNKPVNILNLFMSEFHMIRFRVIDSNNKLVNYSGPSASVVFEKDMLVRLGKDNFVGIILDLRNLEDFIDLKSYYISSKGAYKVTAIYEITKYKKNVIDGVKLWGGKLTSNEILINVN